MYLQTGNLTDTALIIIDMQNAFCSETGSFWKRGNKITSLKQTIINNQKLLSFARKNKWLIVFVKLAYETDYSDGGSLIKSDPQIIQLGAYKKGSWDSEIIDVLKPEKTELIVVKNRYDPFIRTNLLQTLQKNNIKRLIVSGVTTDICVESTVRSAFDYDFETVIVKDATSTTSENLYLASLQRLNHFGQVISLDELMKSFD